MVKARSSAAKMAPLNTRDETNELVEFDDEVALLIDDLHEHK